MHSWIEDLTNLTSASVPVVLLTIAQVRGSVPREVGARMLITSNETIGTIGGGQLEYQCVKAAVALLQNPDEVKDKSRLRRFSLGANCGQCCGGVVDVLFEVVSDTNLNWVSSLITSYRDRNPVALVTELTQPYSHYVLTDSDGNEYDQSEYCSPDVVESARRLLTDGFATEIVDHHLIEPIRDAEFNVAIFGAGHVGAATVDVLRRLDCNIRWIDGRRNIFPANVPDNVMCVDSSEPAREVAALPSDSYFLVMTHSHPLDHDICQQVLSRNDFRYCGLIGSASKRRRFERLLLKQGLTDERLTRLTCPIGVAGISGKKPVEIAISVAAEIMQVRDASLNVCQTPILQRSA